MELGKVKRFVEVTPEPARTPERAPEKEREPVKPPAEPVPA